MGATTVLLLLVASVASLETASAQFIPKGYRPQAQLLLGYEGTLEYRRSMGERAQISQPVKVDFHLLSKSDEGSRWLTLRRLALGHIQWNSGGRSLLARTRDAALFELGTDGQVRNCMAMKLLRSEQASAVPLSFFPPAGVVAAADGFRQDAALLEVLRSNSLSQGQEHFRAPLLWRLESEEAETTLVAEALDLPTSSQRSTNQLRSYRRRCTLDPMTGLISRFEVEWEFRPKGAGSERRRVFQLTLKLVTNRCLDANETRRRDAAVAEAERIASGERPSNDKKAAAIVTDYLRQHRAFAGSVELARWICDRWTQRARAKSEESERGDHRAWTLRSSDTWDLATEAFSTEGPASPIRGQDLEGREWDLGELRGRKVALLFWSSRQSTPRRSFALARQLIDKHKGKLVLLGINTERRERRERNLIRDLEPGFPQLLSQHAAAEEYWVTWLPELILVDEKGQLRGRFNSESKDRADTDRSRRR